MQFCTSISSSSSSSDSSSELSSCTGSGSTFFGFFTGFFNFSSWKLQERIFIFCQMNKIQLPTNVLLLTCLQASTPLLQLHRLLPANQWLVKSQFWQYDKHVFGKVHKCVEIWLLVYFNTRLVHRHTFKALGTIVLRKFGHMQESQKALGRTVSYARWQYFSSHYWYRV